MQSDKNRKRSPWVLLPAALIVGSGLLWQARSGTPRKEPGKSPEVSVRTVRVSAGSLERTIRLAGSTAPERYASLLAPRLRGSRRGPGSSSSAG
ncbi:MAG: hypothetical protein ABSE73_30580, partial [Planctomycetota bacterium]